MGVCPGFSSGFPGSFFWHILLALSFMFTFHIYTDTSKIIKELKKLQAMAVTKEQFQQAIAELNTALEDISTRIGNSGGLSTADEDELFAATNSARDRARQIADQLNQEPTPQP